MRFVGGAVRDSLLGMVPQDFDVATTWTPEEVLHLLKKAQILVIPTGISHGTVTAILDHVPYQITTLRQDIWTDGRHARVQFTKSWKQDAARRDFTFNALFVDRAGHISDYFQGVEDLRAGIVRFIGNPSQRIQEDVLRILRFCRFQAYYGQKFSFTELDWEACCAHRDAITTLSAERITHEFLKLLAAPYPIPVLSAMESRGILKIILPGPFNRAKLRTLLEWEKVLGCISDPLIRLAVLTPNIQGGRLRLSKKENVFFKFIIQLLNDYSNSHPLPPLQELLYRYDGNISHILMLYAAQSYKDPNEVPSDFLETFRQSQLLIQTWTKPIFPLTGQDMLNVGLKGAEIKKWIQEMEAWWIAKGFFPSRSVCLQELSKRISKFLK